MQQRQLKFNIVSSVGMAFFYLQKNYLLAIKMGLVLVIASIVTEIFMFYGLEDVEGLFGSLLRLPEMAIEAWVAFIVARHVIFEENIYCLPKDSGFVKKRSQLLQIAVVLSVLIELVSVGIFLMLIEWNKSEIPVLQSTFDPVSIIALVFFFWALRLKVLPVVVASGMSIRQFLTDVKGMMFSFRLLGLLLLCLLPIWFLSQILLLPIIENTDPVTSPLTLSTSQRLYYFLVSGILSLVKTIVVTVALVSALKEMYGSKPLSV